MTSTHSPFMGPKILLEGPSGTGKTSSLRTLVEMGFEVVAVFTEPTWDIVADIPHPHLRVQFIAPAVQPWDSLAKSVHLVTSLSHKQLCDLTAIEKEKHQEFESFYACLSNFTDLRTGENLGCVDSFSTGRVLWIDSLTGLNVMAMQAVIGKKPVRAKSDWGEAMNLLESFIHKLTTGVHCPVVLVAHVEKEVDELTGQTSITVSTLGQKLAPKIIPWFSDIILTRRNGKVFQWSTSALGADLKARNLPYEDQLSPSFSHLISSWQSRGGIIEPPNARWDPFTGQLEPQI